MERPELEHVSQPYAEPLAAPRPAPPLSTAEGRGTVPLSDGALRQAKTTDLARTLADRMALLAKKELELARAEARVELKRGLVAGGFFGVTGVFFVASLCCGLVCAILAVGKALDAPIWVALFACCFFALLGIATGMATAQEVRGLKPERSLRQAKRTANLLRHPTTAEV